MDLYGSLGGMVTLEVTSAEPSAALDAICSASIPIYGAREEDELHVTFRIQRNNLKRVRKICSSSSSRAP